MSIDPRNGAPKPATGTPPIHGGMSKHSQAGAGVGGRGHAVAVVSGGQTITASAPAAPLLDAYGTLGPKAHTPAPIHPGMASKTRLPVDKATLGRALFDEAFNGTSGPVAHKHGVDTIAIDTLHTATPTIKVEK